MFLEFLEKKKKKNTQFSLVFPKTKRFSVYGRF